MKRPLSAAAVLSLLGGAVLAAYVWRWFLLETAFLLALVRLGWQAAKAKLGIKPSTRRRGSRLATWVEAAGVAYIAWHHRPAAKRKTQVVSHKPLDVQRYGEFPRGY